jgi:hypothetical protein
MIIGILQVELLIDGSQSLKDKRRVVLSLKDRLHREHQVSVAEVDSLEDHRVAILGITMASNSVTHCQSSLDSLVNKMRQGRGYVLHDHRIEILSGQ